MGPQQFGAFIEITAAGTQVTIMERDAARLDALEEGQREIIATLADMKTTMNQLSLDAARNRERRGVEHHGERRSRQSSTSMHVMPRAEAKRDFHGDSDSGRSRHDEEQQWDRWRDESDHSRGANQGRRRDDRGYHDEDSEASYGGRPLHRRRPFGQGHYFGPQRGHGWRGARDGHDRREERYQYQRLKKPKIDFPRFSGGDPHEWLDKAKHYFHMYEVPREERVDVACFFLDGRASKWWRWLKFRCK